MCVFVCVRVMGWRGVGEMYVTGLGLELFTGGL